MLLFGSIEGERLMNCVKLLFFVLFCCYSIAYSETDFIQKNNNYFELPLTTLNGKSLKLADYQTHKPIYLKFWASWCQPCLKQMPHFQKTYVQYGQKITFIGINIDINDSRSAIKNVVEKYAISAPMAIDHSGTIAQAFNLIGTPYHILLDRRGNVVFKGHDTSKQLDKVMDLLANNESPKLPPIPIITEHKKVTDTHHMPQENTALFFTSTWCDWYLKDSQPAMSNNCSSAQNFVNQRVRTHSKIQWKGFVSKLWTDEDSLKKYQNRYQIKYPLMIDSNNNALIKHQVKTYPSLILFHHGVEVFRTSDFSNPTPIDAALNKLVLE